MLPQQFVDMINGCGAAQFEGLTQTLQSSHPTTSVRINPRKGVHLPTDADRVPWCDLGMYLPDRVPFTFDPAMHQGLYYVQEASSMFIAEALRQTLQRLFPDGAPLNYLDACAAPGGKTSLAAFLLPEGSCIVANEIMAQRCDVLMENLQKAGIDNAIVTNVDACRFAEMGEVFDIIAVDAPCSGEGMMRKEAAAVEQWSPALVRTCADTQRRITDALWAALRPGGVMIYSTCTFNPSENEAVVLRLMGEFGAQPISLDIPAEWGIQPPIIVDMAAYRFIPGKTRGEGLFMTVLRKPGASNPGTSQAPGRFPANNACYTVSPPTIARKASQWLSPESRQMICLTNRKTEALHVLDPRHMPMLQRLIARKITPVTFGLEVAVPKGREYVPTQPLALSVKLQTEAFAQCEVDDETALAFLRGESLSLPDGTPRGTVLLMRLGHPLGFVKNLGNRANNNYPHKWRIMSPREPFSLLNKECL